MRLPEREGPPLHPCGGLHQNRVRPDRRQAIARSVTIREWARGIVARLAIEIGLIGGVVGAHPAERLVMPYVREGKPEAGVAGEVPAFGASDVAFVDLAVAEERQMRIDEQHRVAGRALARTDYPAIRSEMLRIEQ